MPGFGIPLLGSISSCNILRVAFASADHKSTEKTDNLTVFFVLSGSVRTKAARRALIKLTSGFEDDIHET